MEKFADTTPLRITRVVGEAALSRLALFAVAYIAATNIPTKTGAIYHHISNHPLVDMMWRWDAPYYAAIALNGYGWQYGQWNGGNSFFPAYPMLLRPIMALFRIDQKAVALAIGLLVSNLFLIAFVVFLDRLARVDFDDLTARHVRWLIWVAPMSIFFAGMYSESMFLFASVVAIYYSRRGNWLLVTLSAFVAGLTRPLGLALVLPLIYESWQAGFQRKHLLAIGAPAAAYALYVFLVGWQLQAWSAHFQIASSAWNRTLTLPWMTLAGFFAGQPVLFGFESSLVDLAFTLAFLLLSLAAFRLRISYGLFAIGIVMLPLFSGVLVSMPRYVATAFPVYLLIAVNVKGSRLRQFIVYGLSVSLAVVMVARFVNWYWVA